MGKSFIVDGEIRDLIPPLTDDERAALTEQLRADGCRDALVVWAERNILLDGHNRYQICTDLSIKYHVTHKSLPSRNAAIAWVVRNQFGRRNLTPMQRAELALKLKPVIAAEARQKIAKTAFPANPTACQNSDKPCAAKSIDTKKELAKVAGVSHDTIAKAEKVLATAAPKVAAMARKGEISLNVAAKVAALPKDAQEAAAAMGVPAVKAAAKEAPAAKEMAATDQCGIALPEALQSIFARRGEITSAMHTISKAKAAILAAIGANDPLYQFVDAGAVKAGMENAYRALRFGAPYASCPYHAHDKLAAKGCRACNGSGWVGEMQYQNAPESLKMGAK